jgi:hypothetical protein
MPAPASDSPTFLSLLVAIDHLREAANAMAKAYGGGS